MHAAARTAATTSSIAPLRLIDTHVRVTGNASCGCCRRRFVVGASGCVRGREYEMRGQVLAGRSQPPGAHDQAWRHPRLHARDDDAVQGDATPKLLDGRTRRGSGDRDPGGARTTSLICRAVTRRGTVRSPSAPPARTMNVIEAGDCGPGCETHGRFGRARDRCRTGAGGCWPSRSYTPDVRCRTSACGWTGTLPRPSARS